MELPNLNQDRPEFKEGEEMCEFIVRLLVFCGGCVKLGHMKPFVILHSNTNVVQANLKGSPNKQDMLNSYQSYIKQTDNIDIFQGEK